MDDYSTEIIRKSLSTDQIIRVISLELAVSASPVTVANVASSAIATAARFEEFIKNGETFSPPAKPSMVTRIEGVTKSA